MTGEKIRISGYCNRSNIGGSGKCLCVRWLTSSSPNEFVLGAFVRAGI